MANVTRSSSQFPLFNEVHDLRNNQLPTYGDILKCILWCKVEKKRVNGNDPSVKHIVKTITDRVIEIYNRASIPTVSKVRVNELIFGYHLKYQNIIKNYKSTLQSQITKLNAFKESSNILFDFCSCKCKGIILCTCSKEKKVPSIERDFLLDQRNKRRMFIGGVDIITSTKIQQRQDRRNRNKTGEPSGENLFSSKDISTSENSSTEPEEEADDFIPPKTSMKRMMTSSALSGEGSSSTPPKKKQNKVKSYPCFAEACDRVGVSDRGAALLSTSLLEDIGIVATENEDNVIDRSKVK